MTGIGVASREPLDTARVASLVDVVVVYVESDALTLALIWA
jgi:hypothetical protein